MWLEILKIRMRVPRLILVSGITLLPLDIAYGSCDSQMILDQADSLVVTDIFVRNGLNTDSLRKSISCIGSGAGQGRINGITLNGKGLNDLPETMDKLDSLSYLEISSNALTHLPQAIGKLAGLRLLDIRNNSLPILPNNVVNLGLGYKAACSVPEHPELSLCTYRGLYIEGNRLCSLSTNITDWIDSSYQGYSRYSFPDTSSNWRITQQCGAPIKPEMKTHRVHSSVSFVVPGYYPWFLDTKGHSVDANGHLLKINQYDGQKPQGIK